MTDSEVSAAWALFCLGCVLLVTSLLLSGEGLRGPWGAMRWLGLCLILSVVVRVFPVMWGIS